MYFGFVTKTFKLYLEGGGPLILNISAVVLGGNSSEFKPMTFRIKITLRNRSCIDWVEKRKGKKYMNLTVISELMFLYFL